MPIRDQVQIFEPIASILWCALFAAIGYACGLPLAALAVTGFVVAKLSYAVHRRLTPRSSGLAQERSRLAEKYELKVKGKVTPNKLKAFHEFHFVQSGPVDSSYYNTINTEWAEHALLGRCGGETCLIADWTGPTSSFLWFLKRWPPVEAIAVFFPTRLRRVPNFRLPQTIHLPSGSLQVGDLDDPSRGRFQIHSDNSNALAQFLDDSLRKGLRQLAFDWRVESRDGRMICWRSPPARGSLEDVLKEALAIRQLVREASGTGNADDSQTIHFTCPMCGAETNATGSSCQDCGEDLAVSV